MAVAEKDWRIVGTPSLKSFKDRDSDLALYYLGGQESRRKYLRFWGNDYLYLGRNRDCEPRWLPIPENSDAQRMIRDLNQKIQCQE